MIARHVGVVKGGAVQFADPIRWRAAVGRLEGKRVLVTVQREKEARSLRANAYLWGVVYRTIAEWSGHDDEEIHEAMKRLHLPSREMVMPTGEVVSLPGSTAELDSGAFSEYVARVKRWAAEQGLYVPEPDEIEVAL